MSIILGFKEKKKFILFVFCRDSDILGIDYIVVGVMFKVILIIGLSVKFLEIE